eukprot:scaffold169497_cov14-Tisochrysis_lutea.AAC.1
MRRKRHIQVLALLDSAWDDASGDQCFRSAAGLQEGNTEAVAHGWVFRMRRLLHAGSSGNWLACPLPDACLPSMLQPHAAVTYWPFSPRT